jgi:hypothetical protein
MQRSHRSCLPLGLHRPRLFLRSDQTSRHSRRLQTAPKQATRRHPGEGSWPPLSRGRAARAPISSGLPVESRSKVRQFLRARLRPRRVGVRNRVHELEAHFADEIVGSDAKSLRHCFRVRSGLVQRQLDQLLLLTRERSVAATPAFRGALATCRAGSVVAAVPECRRQKHKND